MKSLNVWMLQIAEPMPFTAGVRKMRSALLSEELARRGHKVLWWTSAFDHANKKWMAQDDEVRPLMPNVDVRFIKGSGYTKNVSLRRFADHRLVAERFAERAAKSAPPDIIVASMPSYDMSYEASLYAKKHNIPIIIDIRDQWPDIFLHRLPAFLRPLASALLFKDNRMLREQFSGADSLVSMMDSLLAWGQKKGGRTPRPEDKVFYIGATTPAPPDAPFPGLPEGKFIVSFVGTFGAYYAPFALLRAAKRLREHKDIFFVLGGSGDFYEDIASKARGMENVLLPGWLNTSQMCALLSRSHAGVIPAAPGTEAFPNKAFVYFSMGLPLLSSLEGDLQRMLESHEAGLYFPAEDDEKLSELILRLKNDSALHGRMAANSARLFREKLEAGGIYRSYADHVENIAAPRGKAPLI